METQTPAPAPPVKSSRTAKDMALSLLVLLVPVILLVGAYRLLQGGDQPVAADTSPAIDRARRADKFPVVTPEGLGDGWRAASAAYVTEDDGSTTLRLGYTSPHDGALQVIQSNQDASQLLARELGPAPHLTGPVDINGVAWQRYSAQHNATALVLTQPGKTTVVLGQAQEVDLITLTKALR